MKTHFDIDVFTPKELGNILAGSKIIDVADWRANTYYSGYTRFSSQIKWFWEIVNSMDNEQRRKLLKFATGTIRPASSRLRILVRKKWNNSIQNYHERKANDGQLPCSHLFPIILICRNTHLKDYESKVVNGHWTGIFRDAVKTFKIKIKCKKLFLRNDLASFIYIKHLVSKQIPHHQGRLQEFPCGKVPHFFEWKVDNFTFVRINFTVYQAINVFHVLWENCLPYERFLKSVR